MRYIYKNLAYKRSGAAHGLACDPVLDARGKCVRGGGKALVRFEDDAEAIVIARCLRLTPVAPDRAEARDGDGAGDTRAAGEQDR